MKLLFIFALCSALAMLTGCLINSLSTFLFGVVSMIAAGIFAQLQINKN